MSRQRAGGIADRRAASGKAWTRGRGSVASAVWVNRLAWPHDIVFIEVDGESLAGGEGGRSMN